MSKYRRVSSHAEIKEKKTQKIISHNNEENYVDTKSLMEKLGIKITNEDIYGRASDVKKKLKGEANNIKTTKIKEKEKSNVKDKDLSSKNLPKRNKKEIKNISSSLDKKLMNKEKIQNEIIEKKYTKVEKNTKSKNNILDNNENIIKKKTFKKEDEKIISKIQSTSINEDKKKFKRISQIHNELDVKNLPYKSKKDITKPTFTLYRNDDSGLKEDDANRTSFAKFFIHQKSEKLKLDEDDEDIKRSQTKKPTQKKAKEKKNDLETKEEKPKKRKNKAISMDKVVGTNKIFDFKSKKSSLKKSKITNNKESKNTDDEKNLSSDNGNDNSFELNDKGEESKEPKFINHSNKKIITEMASHEIEFNNPLNAEKEKEISSKNVKNGDEKVKEKEIKKSLIEFIPLSKMEEKEIKRSKKKRLTEVTNKSEQKTSFAASYLRRRTMLNPMMGENLDLLVNDMVLKQNGGNSLFLTNFEKGPTYEKEIEIFVKNQNVKKR